MSLGSLNSHGQDKSRKIRVMLVDDSAVIRGLIARTLEAEDDIEIVGSVHNGLVAVNNIAKSDPDVVILDIEMPEMDGLTALPLLLKASPRSKVLMCSTLSARGADVSIRAMDLGAADCIVKPTSSSEIGGSEDFKGNLIRLVRGLSKVAGPRDQQPADATASKFSAAQPTLVRPAQQETFTLKSSAEIYTGAPSLIAIGSSTGGPQALFTVLKHLKNVNVPIVITQHMPKTFTALLAKHIEQNCGVPAFEGADGMRIEAGKAYVATGGYHMVFEKMAGGTNIKIVDTEPENYCKPSVEPMMRSAISIYGNKILAVMLTGMGSDGLKSFTSLADMGGRIIAQNKESSVVWGMPGAVATAGICAHVMPLDEIGPWIEKNA